MKSRTKQYEVLYGSNGASICRVVAERVKVNSRSDMYEFYIGSEVVAWVPKFSTIVKKMGISQ